MKFGRTNTLHQRGAWTNMVLFNSFFFTIRLCTKILPKPCHQRDLDRVEPFGGSRPPPQCFSNQSRSMGHHTMVNLHILQVALTKLLHSRLQEKPSCLLVTAQPHRSESWPFTIKILCLKKRKTADWSGSESIYISVPKSVHVHVFVCVWIYHTIYVYIYIHNCIYKHMSCIDLLMSLYPFSML